MQEEAALKPEREVAVKDEEVAPKEEKEEPDQAAQQEAEAPKQDAAAAPNKRGYEEQLGLLDLHLAYLWRVRLG
jgi:hypothetical protein